MDQTGVDALSELEATRSRLESDLEVLKARLPPTEVLQGQAATGAVAVAGAGLGLATLVAGLRRRARRRAREAAQREQARVTAEELARILDDDGAPGPGGRSGRSPRRALVLLGGLLGLALTAVRLLSERRTRR